MMSNYDQGTIRKLLVEVFPNEEDFSFFCEDYFAEVVGKFTEGMSLAKKAQTLAQHCLQNNQVDKLLPMLERTNPGKYAEYRGLLYLPDAPTPSPDRTPVAQVAPSLPVSSSGPASVSTGNLTPPVETPGERPSVFISYSRRDSDFVKQLYQKLTGRGVSAWFDKENIEVADHWRTSIVEGIRDCKAFVLVLSPDSTASENVRKEVDLAERYKRRIVPLMWRTTEIPVAMEYQLAGIQWIDFKENASQENFGELADVLQQLVGGASLPQATIDKSIVRESTIPAVNKVEPSAGSPKPTIGGVKRGQVLSPIAIGGAVISSVVTTLNLSTEKSDDGTSEKDRVNDELKWLFRATDNFLQVKKGRLEPNHSIDAPIPSYAEKQPQANNRLLSNIDNFNMGIWEGTIESGLKRIDIHLKNLDILLKQEASKGKDAQGDVYLQNQLKGGRIEIIKVLRELAELMNQAYGILVTSPEELVVWLEQ